MYSVDSDNKQKMHWVYKLLHVSVKNCYSLFYDKNSIKKKLYSKFPNIEMFSRRKLGFHIEKNYFWQNLMDHGKIVLISVVL